jgi:hypothetical protein
MQPALLGRSTSGAPAFAREPGTPFQNREALPTLAFYPGLLDPMHLKGRRQVASIQRFDEVRTSAVYP